MEYTIKNLSQVPTFKVGETAFAMTKSGVKPFTVEQIRFYRPNGSDQVHYDYGCCEQKGKNFITYVETFQEDDLHRNVRSIIDEIKHDNDIDL